jgi:cysteine desulfurase/selenocysteine lyase
MKDFEYLGKNDVYFDSACQSLRPQPVIDALTDYYTKFNSCGERVKYKWGVTTDDKVNATREKLLSLLKLKSRDYFVSFTLNTTYGINLVLDQISTNGIKQVITSDIEHNSPFLATIAFARKHNLPRKVVVRDEDGSIDAGMVDWSDALVVLNVASNIDGRKLKNLKELVKKIHKNHGVIIIDAAQAMAHAYEILEKTEADVICLSAHKMYAPSLGAMVVRKSLLPQIKTTFIGGGMVDDVELSEYKLSAENPEHVYTKFESGLQAWGEIVALGAAIDWLKNQDRANLENYSKQIFKFLKSAPKVHLVNREVSPVISFYMDGMDSHLLGAALSQENIMIRSGYFCCHYYLDHVKHYPPLVRLSLGLHNRQSDVDKFITVMEQALGR